MTMLFQCLVLVPHVMTSVTVSKEELQSLKTPFHAICYFHINMKVLKQILGVLVRGFNCFQLRWRFGNKFYLWIEVVHSVKDEQKLGV